MNIEIQNTKDRKKVELIRKLSIQLVNEGKATEIKNWESPSPWHNSKFTETSTGKAWVIYLPDQAWDGEVKVFEAKS
jgi:hypothetical protein